MTEAIEFLAAEYPGAYEVTIPQTAPSIYVLVDPRNPGVVVYVGKTINPLRRFWQHLATDDQKAHKPKQAWVRELNDAGLLPLMFVIATVKAEDAMNVERATILHYRAKGQAIFNDQHMANDENHAKHQETHRKAVTRYAEYMKNQSAK